MEEQLKKRTFKKFSFRGVDLDQLLDLSTEQLVELFHSRVRRRFSRGLKKKPMGLIKKLRKVSAINKGKERVFATRETQSSQDPLAQHDHRS
jgi:small subunit ribosomal protein S15e